MFFLCHQTLATAGGILLLLREMGAAVPQDLLSGLMSQQTSGAVDLRPSNRPSTTQPETASDARCDVARVALCMTGQTRTLPEVAKNVHFTHVTAVGESCVDTFIVADITGTWKGATRTPGRPRDSLKSYFHQVHEAFDLFKPVAMDVHPETDGGEYPYVETYLGCANTTKPPDKLARHEFEKNYRCWKLVQKQEQKRGQRYEWALRLRTDISYAVALPPFEVRFLALQ